MVPETFATHSLKKHEQADAWRAWFEPLFDVAPLNAGGLSFSARNTIWKLDDLVVSRVSAPAVRVQRSQTHVRRSSIDHWVLSYYQTGEITIRTSRKTLRSRPGVPFLWSLGEPSEAIRTDTDRLQIFLSRDVFRDIAPVLDAARNAVLETPLGRLLGDFMLSLEHRLQGLEIADMPRLTAATRALIAACVAPSADSLASAKNQIDQSRMERIRQTVRTHLRSPRLGPGMLCRAVGMSRSSLYRLLESESGVAHYVQRQRLLEARAVLSDPKNKHPISAIAEELCFADPSSFGRAFRNMFGHSATEFRSAALAGMMLPGKSEKSIRPDEANFITLLRGF
jgi:AraC-like DNA-binding protein